MIITETKWIKTVIRQSENCDEEQTKQLRSRTALTRKGPSSRLLDNSLMKRI